LNAFMTREGYEAKRSGFLVTFEVPSSWIFPGNKFSPNHTKTQEPCSWYQRWNQYNMVFVSVLAICEFRKLCIVLDNRYITNTCILIQYRVYSYNTRCIPTIQGVFLQYRVYPYNTGCIPTIQGVFYCICSKIHIFGIKRIVLDNRYIKNMCISIQ
jgi:hypothetical protein